MRRILAISSIGNQPHNLHGKYVPGSGVGACSVSTRRLKLYKATSKTTSSQTQTPTQIQYLSLSDVAQLTARNNWTLTVNVIASYQYLIIPATETLVIPAGMTFTNNGRIDNGGVINAAQTIDESTGSRIDNTGVLNNSGTITILSASSFNTYGGGITNNNYVPDIYGLKGINNYGIFRVAASGSACGSGTFTGNALNTGSVTTGCPP